MPGGSPRGCPASPCRHRTTGPRTTVTTERSESVEGTSPVCSAKGCRAAATWVLAWNNPKLHTPDRRKTWTACDEHKGAAHRVPGRPRVPPRDTHRRRVGGVSRRSLTSGAPAAGSRARRCRARAAWPSARRASARRGPRRTAPARIAVRRSDSSRAKRQLRSWPSAVSRTRSQAPQNGRVTDPMTPTRPGPPSTSHSSAGALPRSSCSTAVRVNAVGQPVEDLVGRDHLGAVPAVLGVERHLLDEAQPVAAASAQRSSGTASSSLTPRTSTALTLTGVSPAASAAASPSSTSASRSRRAMAARTARGSRCPGRR